MKDPLSVTKDMWYQDICDFLLWTNRYSHYNHGLRLTFIKDREEFQSERTEKLTDL